MVVGLKNLITIIYQNYCEVFLSYLVRYFRDIVDASISWPLGLHIIIACSGHVRMPFFVVIDISFILKVPLQEL